MVCLCVGQRREQIQDGQFHTRDREHVSDTRHRVRILRRLSNTIVRFLGRTTASSMENPAEVYLLNNFYFIDL